MFLVCNEKDTSHLAVDIVPFNFNSAAMMVVEWRRPKFSKQYMDKFGVCTFVPRPDAIGKPPKIVLYSYILMLNLYKQL